MFGYGFLGIRLRAGWVPHLTLINKGAQKLLGGVEGVVSCIVIVG